MANQRRDPVTYRPFRTEPIMAEGLLAVERPGGDFLDRVSQGLFRLAAEQGQIADRQAERAGALAGQQAALDGRPRASVSGNPGLAPATGGRQLTGSKAEKAAAAKAYLMSKHGVSNEFASGLVGQFAQESSFNTRARNPGDGSDGSDSVGIAQWNGKRAQSLRAFAASRGKPVDDFELQLDFVMHELSTTERAVGNRLRGARTVEEATAAAIGYERPRGWTPQNPSGGHGWGNRLAAARQVYGAAASAGAAPAGIETPPAAPEITVAGGSYQPTRSDTIYGRAYDQAGARTYAAQLEGEMRSTTGQMFQRYRDDPAGLEVGLRDLKTALGRDHVFPEIQADFEVGFDRLASSYLDQSRENLARKVETQDRADYLEAGNQLSTDLQQRIADFDANTPGAADAIASAQAAIDAHFDGAVQRGVIDPDDAARAKIDSRREAALGFYGKQAEALDADGIAAMRTEMEKDFADGGVEGLDGEGFATLDRTLKAREEQKRRDAKSARDDFADRGNALAARIGAGFEVNQADLQKLAIESGTTPEGKAAMQETYAKISSARAVRDMNVRDGEIFVKGLRKQYGDAPSETQLRRLAFAEDALAKKKAAISADPVSYAESQGIVPETPMLTETPTVGDLVNTVGQRVKAASVAADAFGMRPRFLKAGEAKAVADWIRKDPDQGSTAAAAIVAGAGDAAPAVLAEFGADAPMIAEAGAILAFGGSARAASDVIGGYGKGIDGKALKSMKPADSRAGFLDVSGSALALAPKDAQRVERAAAAIARKRIAEEGVDIDSEEAIAIHGQAVNEAAGATFDRGVQYGGFTDSSIGMFSTGGAKVLVPPGMRADQFIETLGLITDDDLAGIPVKPLGGTAAYERSPASMLRRATPVAVDGGYAFSLGDPAGEDPQFIQGDDGNVFVLDPMKLRDRLEPRVPGAFR